ncbi:Hypothetical protein CINCED_3A005564 [Cinara cedri]|uniref:Uncharacterized protein n=1 Tax=Cinara cedri TaxID=506608 RepID=A0A5E4M8S3_9HEMI|nr:Hypothetical protein CINCED_3A005564 [Cinara cedri]
MNDEKLLKEARALEARLVGFEKVILDFDQYMNDLTNSLQLLQTEESALEEKLAGLNSVIDDYQNKLNKLKMENPNVETVVDKTKTNILENKFEAEVEELENKLDRVWNSFSVKNSELDDKIKQAELKIAERQSMISKKYRLEIDKYKKAIDKLREENTILENKLNIISKTQVDLDD